MLNNRSIVSPLSRLCTLTQRTGGPSRPRLQPSTVVLASNSPATPLPSPSGRRTELLPSSTTSLWARLVQVDELVERDCSNCAVMLCLDGHVFFLSFFSLFFLFYSSFCFVNNVCRELVAASIKSINQLSNVIK